MAPKVPLPTLLDRTLFRDLADQWYAKTGMLSVVAQAAMHPAYQAIIGMGTIAIPLILDEMRTHGPTHWAGALRELTHENPIRPEDHGYVDRITKRWLQWGAEQGYITARDGVAPWLTD